MDFLVLAGEDIGNRASVCSSPADLGKLDKAVHLPWHDAALPVFWTCHLDAWVETSPTSLSSVLIVTGASGRIILQNKTPTYESWKKTL